MKTIALVSDTHGLLRPEVLEGLHGVQSILHMGDVGDPAILDELEAIAPVHAVRGNCDHGGWASTLPETKAVDIFGSTGYLIHNLDELDVDPAAAGIPFVFYGHTHKPKEEERAGVRFINPGSIGPRRFTLPISYALLREDLTLEFATIR